MVGFGGKRTTTVEIEEAVEERFGAIDITFCGWLWADGTEEAKPKVISKKSGRFRKWQRKRN